MKNYLIIGCMLGAISFAQSSYADLKCGGTEPFWGLTIGAKRAVYEPMEGSKVEFDSVVSQDAQGIKPYMVRNYTLKNSKTLADAVILKQKCDDGMSDVTYPYNITLTIMKTVFSGCCR